jgi:hypothetical protein
VIVPREGDSKLVTMASHTYCDSLHKAGIKVFQYGPPMLHAKTMVVDDTVAVVGTANLDNRSFRLNFEVAAAFYDAGVIKHLAKRFEQDRAASTLRSSTAGAARASRRCCESIARAHLASVVGRGTSRLPSSQCHSLQRSHQRPAIASRHAPQDLPHRLVPCAVDRNLQVRTARSDAQALDAVIEGLRLLDVQAMSPEIAQYAAHLRGVHFQAVGESSRQWIASAAWRARGTTASSPAPEPDRPALLPRRPPSAKNRIG